MNGSELSKEINEFAIRCFRDMADGDYIAARLAGRAGLWPQFLWSSQQAIEKYMKYLFLANRVVATQMGHNLSKGLDLLNSMPYPVEVCPLAHGFIKELADQGLSRYLERPMHVVGYPIVLLDMAVWDLRRYCHVLSSRGRDDPTFAEDVARHAAEITKMSSMKPRHSYRLQGGLLESILADRSHPARAGLLWQNPRFGTRSRKTIKAKPEFWMINTPLYLFPEMLDELLKYVKIPKDVIKTCARQPEISKNHGVS